MEWEPPQLDATTCRHEQGLRSSPFDLLHAILDHIYTYTKAVHIYAGFKGHIVCPPNKENKAAN